MRYINFRIVNSKTTIVTLLFLLAQLLFVSVAKADELTESQKSFDSIYAATASQISTEDIQKAHRIADSLLLHSTDDTQKIRSLMLISSLHFREGNVDLSVFNAESAFEIAVKTSNYTWQIRILGFLAQQYISVELFDQSLAYIKKGKEVSKKITDEQEQLLYYAFFIQEEANLFRVKKEYEKAYSLAKEADIALGKLEDGPFKSYQLLLNEGFQAGIKVETEEWQKALHHSLLLERGIKENKLEEDVFLKSYLHFSLGISYLHLDSLDKAITYLKSAESINDQSGYSERKMGVYRGLAKYYKEVSDYEKQAEYSDLLRKEEIKYEAFKKEYVKKLLNKSEHDNIYLSKAKSFLIFGISGLIAIVLGLIIWYQYAKKRSYERFKVRLAAFKERMEEPKSLSTSKKVDSSETTVVENEAEKLMPQETIHEILSGLVKFENGKKFLDKNISLSMLSNILQANSKYVSLIIKEYRSPNFNAYINELRIKYILKMLEEDKMYRKYSISYLAEECGFSTHSRFSSVFKSITGFSPSKFIDYLNQEER